MNISLDEIKSKAPCGATGYCLNCDGLWYWSGDYVWFDNTWIFSKNQSKNIKPL